MDSRFELQLRQDPAGENGTETVEPALQRVVDLDGAVGARHAEPAATRRIHYDRYGLVAARSRPLQVQRERFGTMDHGLVTADGGQRAAQRGGKARAISGAGRGRRQLGARRGEYALQQPLARLED